MSRMGIGCILIYCIIGCMGTHASSVALDMLNVIYMVAYLNVYLFMLSVYVLALHWGLCVG